MKQGAPLELVKLTSRRGMSDSSFERVMELLAERRVSASDDLLGAYAETVDESFFIEDDPAMPDCRECGACCSYFHRIPVQLTDPTPRMFTWVVWEAGAAGGPKLLWMRREPEAGCCVAFNGRVGESAFCAIYELRPGSCREFEAGSDRCHAVRRLYGLEPRLSESEQRRRACVLSLRERDDEGRAEGGFEESFEGNAPEISDETGRLRLLGELVRFSAEKIERIISESERLLEFFEERGIPEGADRCRRVMEAIGEDAKAVAQEQARIAIPGNLETLEPRQLEELSRDILRAGVVSHEALERASRWLVDLGRFAFEASGMRERVSGPRTARFSA